MKKNKNIPEIRFKGFEGEWTNSQMSVLADYSKGRGYTKNDLIKNGTPIILYGRLYTKYSTSISEVDTFVVDKKGSVYSKGGEVIVPASGETAEDIAIASVVEMPGIILGGDLNIIRLNNKIHPLFLALSISHGQQHNELSKKAQGKSIVHLQNSDIKETTLIYPRRKEQSRIGSFFKKLDKLITLEQQKHDKLQSLKKAMLEKMFPKEDADIPEIRFKEFEGGWKDKKLSEITKVSTGYPFKSHLFNDIGKYLVITNGNIQDNLPFVDDSIGNKVDISDEYLLNEYILKKNDILVTMDGTVGRTAKIKEKNQILAQRVGRLTTTINPEFLYQLLNTGKFSQEMVAISHGGTIKHISLSEISSYRDFVPSSIEEQSQIGYFFQNLDSLISLQQQKIEKLKNIKKACLEKMFV